MTLYYKILYVIVFAFVNQITDAKAPFPTKQQVGMFINSETCVVIQGDQLQDAALKNAVSSTWKLTKTRFIDKAAFDTLRFSSKYSFIFISKLTFKDDLSESVYNYLNLTLGDSTLKLEEMPEFSALPLAYADDHTFAYTSALEPMLLFMQRHIKEIQEHYFMVKISGLNYYNKYAKHIKDNGTLLLSESDLAPDLTIEGIKNIYKGKIEFLDYSGIANRIKKRENIIFLHQVKPIQDNGRGRNFKFLFDSKGQLFYYEVDKIDLDSPSGFDSDDLGRID